jgi:hypothetical protein
VDAASDPVKSRRADAAVELLSVEFDVVEIMLERLLADKFVNRIERLLRFRSDTRAASVRHPVGGPRDCCTIVAPELAIALLHPACKDRAVAGR